jgi:hypothetical protein
MMCESIFLDSNNLRMIINQQQYQYSKSGYLTFSHPAGSHDDQLWSLALSCYAAPVGREKPPLLI